MKILTIVGARPQFIKAATISRQVKNHDEMSEVFVHTGQHYDKEMSDIFFNHLEIPIPNYNLGIGSGSHGQQTGRMLAAIEEVAEKEAPDVAIVYGDTNSTIAGALGCTKLHIPVAHVEAGLRSFNRDMPEEVNRILTDHASDILFTPSEKAVENLRDEGVASRVHHVGDVMYDAALYYRKKIADQSYNEKFVFDNPYILATVHRAENTNDSTRLLNIFDALARVAQKYCVVMPLHPRTKKALDREGQLDRYGQSIEFIEPVGYLSMIQLERNAESIVTDSGGVQKEAYYHGVPCVTLRDETEWTELIEIGANRLVPPASSQAVYEGVMNPPLFQKENMCDSLYGEGNASEKIVEYILKVY